MMSRVVTIPKAAGHPGLAKLFLDYLLSERGQAVVGATAGLEPLLRRGAGRTRWACCRPRLGPVQPITLGPALLVFLDRSEARALSRRLVGGGPSALTTPDQRSVSARLRAFRIGFSR